MYKKLVRCESSYFAEVDPVCLKCCAIALKDQILKTVNESRDIYGFYERTMSVIEAAIRGEISQSLDLDEVHVVSGNYEHDMREGIAPPEFDREFANAVGDFCATLEGLSPEETEKIIKDGIVYGWVDFEEEGDWPDKVKSLILP